MPTSPTSDARPLSWYGPARAALLLLAVVALLLGSALDATPVVVVAPLALVGAGALDLGRRLRGATVPGAAPVVVLALIMGAAAFAAWPLDAARWAFVALCLLAIGLSIAASAGGRTR